MTALAKSPPDEAVETAPRGRLFRKYLVSFVAVASAALIVNGAIEAWFSYSEQKRLLIGIQHEQADAAVRLLCLHQAVEGAGVGTPEFAVKRPAFLCIFATQSNPRYHGS